MLTGLSILALTAITAIHLKKKYNKNFQNKYMHDFIDENSSEDISIVSSFWNVQMPVPADKGNMLALKKVLASIRCDYEDCIVVDLNTPVVAGEYGIVTFIQATKRESVYQVELHIDTTDKQDKQYVIFIPELNKVMSVFEELLVRGKVSDLEKWNDCSELLFNKKDED